MTRKDFERIARAVRLARTASHLQGEYERAAIDTVVEELVTELRLSNPRFDAYKFRAACEADAIVSDTGWVSK